MAKRKPSYPAVYEAELERSKKHSVEDEEPDFICGAPNYDKFPDWTPEQVMAWLNID